MYEEILNSKNKEDLKIEIIRELEEIKYNIFKEIPFSNKEDKNKEELVQSY